MPLSFNEYYLDYRASRSNIFTFLITKQLYTEYDMTFIKTEYTNQEKWIELLNLVV